MSALAHRSAHVSENIHIMGLRVGSDLLATVPVPSMEGETPGEQVALGGSHDGGFASAVLIANSP